MSPEFKSPISVEVQGRVEKKDAGATGSTPGQGNVTINTNETRDYDWAKGINKERVGHFRIYKEKEGVLVFHKFWRSEFTTEPDEEKHPPEFKLRYGEKGFEPLDVITQRERVLYQLWIVKLCGIYEVPVHSLDKDPRPKRIAFSLQIGN